MERQGKAEVVCFPQQVPFVEDFLGGLADLRVVELERGGGRGEKNRKKTALLNEGARSYFMGDHPLKKGGTVHFFHLRLPKKYWPIPLGCTIARCH